MQIKKFEAQNITEALRMVKSEFGVDAVILSVRNIENGNKLLGFSKSMGVEVTAATDIQPGNEKARTFGNKYSKKYMSLNFNEEIGNRAGYGKTKRFINSFRAGLNHYSKRDNYTSNIKRNGDIKEIYSAYHQMVEQDVNDSIALELSRKIAELKFSHAYLCPKDIKSCLTKALEQTGISANRVRLEKGRQSVIALIGGTGVGKTTTIAKLAIAAKMREKKKNVALITLDDVKLGAIEHLKVYAKIIGAPLKSVLDKKDLPRYINKMSNFDIIFVDTPGISQRNSDQINDLKEVLHKLNNIEFHLVLSATTNDKTLNDVIAKFKGFNVNRLIFTKLDECLTFGSILNQLYRSKKSVSYFTNGQQVPENIQTGSIESLVNLILDKNGNRKYLKGSPEELAQNIINFERMLRGAKDNHETNPNFANFNDNSSYGKIPDTLPQKKISTYCY